MNLSRLLIILALFGCLVVDSVKAEPKSEFENIEISFAVLQTRLNDLYRKGKARGLLPKQVLPSVQDFEEKIDEYSLKDIDRSYILDPLENLSVALKRAASAKTESARVKTSNEIRKWQGYFATYPVLKILAADTKIYVAGDRLLTGKYAVAEDFFNAAKIDLETARKLIKNAAVAANLASITDHIDELLLYTRREELPNKGTFKRITDRIAKTLSRAHQTTLKALDK